MKTKNIVDYAVLDVQGLQYIYLDFDGEKTVYRNYDLDIVIDVEVQDSKMTETQKQYILSELSAKYADQNIVFTIKKPTKTPEYSTVFIGKTDDFEGYGSFSGLAETIDKGNQIKSDNAFVLADNQTNPDAVICVIAHEIEHIFQGNQHHDSVDTLDDYAAKWFSEENRLDELYNDFQSTAPDLGTLSSDFVYRGSTTGSDDIDYICFTAGTSGTLTISLYTDSNTLTRSNTEVHLNNILSNKRATPYQNMMVSVTKGTRYYFAISNYNLYQTSEFYAWQFSFSGGSSPTPSQDMQSPTVPGSLSHSVSDDDVVFDWANSTDNVGVTGYEFSISQNSSFSGAEIYYSPSSNYELNNLSDGTYHWRVRAKDAAGNYSSWSSSKTFNISSGYSDLVFITPSGWEDKLIISTTKNTSVDSESFSVEDTIYLDFAVKNQGTSYTASSVYVDIYVDNIKVDWYLCSAGLGKSQSYSWSDRSIGTLSVGYHTIGVKIRQDGLETTTSNNSYSKKIYVEDIQKTDDVDLTWHKFLAWDEVVVVTSQKTTQPVFCDSTLLTPSGNVYLQFAIINNGSDWADDFCCSVRVDGKTLAEYTISELGGSDCFEDLNEYPDSYEWEIYDNLFKVYSCNIGKFSAGSHTIEIVVDSENSIAETNENNNVYTKQFTVITPTNYINSALMSNNTVVKITSDGRFQKYSGSTFSTIGAMSPSYNWWMLDSGDFDGDGIDEILWENFTDNGLYVQNSVNSISEVLYKDRILGSVEDDYDFLGVGDFIDNDIDGILLKTPVYGDDNVSRNYGLAVWTYDSKGQMTPGWLGALVNTWWELPPKTGGSTPEKPLNGNYDHLTGEARNREINAQNYQYEFSAVGDFNGDGKDDVMLRNCMPKIVSGETITGSGDVFVFLSDTKSNVIAGNRPVDGIVYAGCATDGWKISGCGDFNGDGTDDVLLSKGSDFAIWKMCNGQRVADSWIGNISNFEILYDIADFNGDGTADILYSDADDNLYIKTIINGTISTSIAVS